MLVGKCRAALKSCDKKGSENMMIAMETAVTLYSRDSHHKVVLIFGRLTLDGRVFFFCCVLFFFLIMLACCCGCCREVAFCIHRGRR